MSARVLALRGDAGIIRCPVPPASAIKHASHPANVRFSSVTSFRELLSRSCGLGRRRLSIRAESVAYSGPKAQRLTLNSCGTEITLETGEIGRQANGAVVLTCGETVLYATACCNKTPTGDGSFVPLTVDYQERFSAVGRTSGGFLKREGRMRDADTLVSRLVDRPLRPMFQPGWAVETQVLTYVLSYDGLHAPEPLAITAAAAALLISDIPLTKAVAGVRVGWMPGPGGGSLLVNPTVEQMKTSRLDLVMAGTRDAILMIEGYCDFLNEEQMLKAIAAGSAAISDMCVALEDWASLVGKSKEKRMAQLIVPPAGLDEAVRDLVASDLEAAFRKVGDKDMLSSAQESSRSRVVEALGQPNGPYTSSQLYLACKALESKILREVVLTEGRRTDGRGVQDVRPISSRAGLLPRCHGSALFTRGETQALCVATLGGASDLLTIDGIRQDGDEKLVQRFYLQYSFPPSSVGEVGRHGMPGRRELGHGELAQRALMPIVPPEASNDWPYTMRVESTITESNGSSSMASVCGGCLALQDAGVPILRPVAGIAMGLILEKDGRFCVLSDILGSEDALGDMDFKVAGDMDSVTAFQMDIKVEGITLEVMSQALKQAREGRRHILGEMAKCSPPPSNKLSERAPFLFKTAVDPTKRGMVIGVGGRTVKQIVEVSGATSVNFNEDGQLEVCAPDRVSGMKAWELVQILLEDPPAGRVFRQCKVTGIQTFGAFVEVAPGRQGLVHVSELDVVNVDEVTKVVKLDDRVDVMVLDCSNGKLSLSRRAVLLADSGQPITSGVRAKPTEGYTPGQASASASSSYSRDGSSSSSSRFQSADRSSSGSSSSDGFEGRREQSGGSGRWYGGGGSGGRTAGGTTGGTAGKMPPRSMPRSPRQP